MFVTQGFFSVFAPSQFTFRVDEPVLVAFIFTVIANPSYRAVRLGTVAV